MLVEEDILERRVTKVPLVWMDSKVHLVHLVRKESQVPEVYLESLDLKAPKDLKVQEEKLDHLDLLVKRVKWASQDSLVILEEEVPKETEDWLVKEEEMAQQVHLAHLELMVIEESLDPEDPEVNEA